MDSDPINISPRVKVLLSFLLTAHLFALVLPPLSVQTRGPIGPSPSVSTGLEWVEPYSQLLYIDRGYAFFAPDPGPSHLIQAAITGPDGQRREKIYPDIEQQRPRLLYHRHFMLSEFLQEIYHPPGPPEELQKVDPQERILVSCQSPVRKRASVNHGSPQAQYPETMLLLGELNICFRI